MTTIIEAISDLCIDASDFSELSLRLASNAITDTFAVMTAGADDASTLAVRKGYMSQFYAAASEGSARVVGGGHAPSSVAAVVNGTAAHALDYDDSFDPGINHASAVAVPALLAVADQHNSSGRDFVAAYLVALQAQAFVAWGVGRPHYTAGWHSTSTVGMIGTAAGAAWLMGCDREGIARALSLAVSFASGVKGQFGTTAKPFHAGLAARNAVEAAYLAAAGLSGRLDILERPQGFGDLYGGNSQANWLSGERIRATKDHVIETIGLAPKRHPCCASTHLVIDALIEMQANHGFTVEEIDQVDTLVGLANWRNLAYPNPKNELEARFSMQYCVARLLRRGRLTLADFTPASVAANIRDPLLSKIAMEHYPTEPDGSHGPVPHQVSVRLKSGDVLTARRALAKGTKDDPFSEADRFEKFLDCCAKLPQERAEAVFRRCEALVDETQLGFLDEVMMR